MKINSLSMLIRYVFVLLIFFGGFASATAQNGLPVYVTMKSSHRFDGVIDPVNGYSPMIVPLGGATTFRIRNGLRQVYVNKKSVANEDAVPQGFTEVEFPIWQDSIDRKRPIGILNWQDAFNESGHRVINVATKHGPKNYVQGITKITPRYVELSALKREKDKTAYTMSIGRGAVPVEIIRTLLHNQISRSDNPVEYEEIFNSFLQAKQYGEALKELELIERRFPDRKEQIERNRKNVRQAEARQIVREIKDRIRNGQPEIARSLGMGMNTDGVAQNILTELKEYLSEIELAAEKVIDVRQEVGDLVKRYQKNPPTKLTADQETMLGQFLVELETELRPSNVARMDSYLVQAADAAQKDQEKVALAISGWLMGSNNATPNFALAQSLFQVRSLIRQYLKSGDANQRKAILDAIKKTESGNNHNFVASMLAQMIPPEHEEATKDYTGEKPIEFTVSVPGTNARPGVQEFQVAVHLPIEYDPYHRYPLMITLPNIGVSVEQQLNMFNSGYLESIGKRVGRASRSGVIVASVQWAKPGQSTPGYSAREHDTVLSAMRACFRKFQIDTDRVFLHGIGKGGNLVYDIGLAHPDHFAGLIPVGGAIEKYAKVHATNSGIPLSIYAVVGEGDWETQNANLDTWNKWLQRGKYVNLILVEYIGRLANDNFLDDHEAMFEWMEFQRRRLPDPAGFEFAIDSLRPWDNYYWFLELNGFPRENVMWPALWKDGKLNALDILGEMKPESDINHFVLKPAKAGRSMTLWLSDEYVDFEKEVRISGRGKFRGGVKPSVDVILEDVRRRGDRLHPFWARIDCNNGKWQVVE